MRGAGVITLASAASLAVLLGFVLAGCAAPAGVDSGGDPGGEGPGGSGVVTAEPPQGVSAVDAETACELAATSSTLAAWSATGTAVDTTGTFALSYCELDVEIPGVSEPGLNVQVVTASDVALTSGIDPAAFSGSFVLLPDVGVDGHFTSPKPDVAPDTDPTAGAITAAKGELGVTLAWATGADVVPYADYERIVTELLAALP